MGRSIVLAFLIVLALARPPGGAASAVPAGGYTSTALGTLGGPASQAFGINAAGRIVGLAKTAAGADRAFFYDGTMRDLGTLGGPASYATAINEAGWIVGWSRTASGETHAALWTPAATPGLPNTGGGGARVPDRRPAGAALAVGVLAALGLTLGRHRRSGAAG